MQVYLMAGVLVNLLGAGHTRHVNGGGRSQAPGVLVRAGVLVSLLTAGHTATALMLNSVDVPTLNLAGIQSLRFYVNHHARSRLLRY